MEVLLFIFCGNHVVSGKHKALTNNVTLPVLFWRKHFDCVSDDFAKFAHTMDWDTILAAVAGGVSPDRWNSMAGGTLLWRAIRENNYDAAQKLIKLGTDTEVKAENGKTALMFAVEMVCCCKLNACVFVFVISYLALYSCIFLLPTLKAQ